MTTPVRPLPVGRLLRPRAVAIVGVSAEAGSIGGAVLANLERHGYRGSIHLVSRTRSEVGGRPCVASVDALPEGVDVAVIAVPRAGVADALGACARRRFGGAIVFAAGYAELDEDGKRDQDALARIAHEAGLSLNGPNCLGYVNYLDGVALSFEPVPIQTPGERPRLGIIAQSGAIAAALRNATLAKAIGISFAISTGNEAALGLEDFLAYLIDDPDTGVIVLFVEQIRRPALFLDLAAAARAKSKPIVMLHPGRSVRARASARTHTGAIAGDYAVMRALASHEAVICVETLEELVDTSTLLARFPDPPAGGAAVMTNSGAFKGFALDFCDGVGLDLPVLAPATVERLRQVLPPFASLENPLDVTAQGIKEPQIFGGSARPLLDDPAVGSLLVAVVPGSPPQAMAKAHSLLPVIAKAAKPAVFAILGDEMPLSDEFVAAIRGNGVPFFRSPERALRALAHATRYGAARAARAAAARPAASLKLPGVPLPKGEIIPEHAAKRFLAALGFPVPQGQLVKDPADVEKAAAAIGYPVALKAQSPALSHKSDIGGIALGIADAASLREAWERVTRAAARAQPGLALDGVLVEAMAKPGIEMAVGGRRDPEWGPVLMVGLGGVWIEALGDVRLMPAALDEVGIIAELTKLKGFALLKGLRGGPAYDVRALAQGVTLIGALLRQRLEIAEIDINPLVVYPQGMGVMALDALIVVR